MYATYSIIGSRIVMDYTSSNGDWLGGERIDIRPSFKGDLQQVAYNNASVRATTHGLRLEALMRAA